MIISEDPKKVENNMHFGEHVSMFNSRFLMRCSWKFVGIHGIWRLEGLET